MLPDLVGLTAGHKPRFVKQYAALGDAMDQALAAYVEEVREGVFPGPEHSYE